MQGAFQKTAAFLFSRWETIRKNLQTHPEKSNGTDFSLSKMKFEKFFLQIFKKYLQFCEEWCIM
jgi:hypothetical protein